MSSFVHGCEKPDKDRGAALGPRKLQRVTSLSVDPPQLLVNINRQASSFSLIARHRTFGANILGADQRDIAERFSNGRFKGKERFDGFSWNERCQWRALAWRGIGCTRMRSRRDHRTVFARDRRRTPRRRRTVPAAVWPRILKLRVCRDRLSPDFNLIAAAGSPVCSMADQQDLDGEARCARLVRLG
ncbi:hypothetical protein ACVWZ6_001764 [Bradyrhizobium sp. GM6.1]